ncbi:hypothetical protein RSAG8_00344, partial [Rhizoctonia solani AG-8 WAC10335]
MPDTSEVKPFLSSEELRTPLSTNSPSRAFSIDSSASAQSDRTIRPPPRTSSPLAWEAPPRPRTDYKRKASPWWLIPIVAISALIYAGTIAPRTELLVKLACNNLHPGWDLVSNSTSAHKNETTTPSSSHPRGFFERLHFVERLAPLQKRSQITTPGTSPMCSDDDAVQKEVAKLYQTGIIFAGMALGPGFGSLLIKFTGNAMLIFYIAAVSDLIYALYVAFILPESIGPERMQAAREAKRRSQKSSTVNPVKNLVLNVLGVLAPFTIFFPRAVQRPGGRKKYEWNASFIGLAYALHAVNSGSYSFKYQYAIKAFGWSSTQMGNWLSLLGFTRAFHLTILLPLILKGIHWLRERKPPIKPLSDSDKAQSVDLLVARVSLGVDISSYSASALVTTSNAFLGTSTILSFGGGYPPAIQSLALVLTQTSKAQDAATVNLTSDEPRFEGSSIDTTAPDDTGRLLGAMSVVYTLCSQIFGPSLFGALFVATVGSAPRSIFWLSAVLNGLALGSLLLVRLKPSSDTEDDVEYVLLNNMED